MKKTAVEFIVSQLEVLNLIKDGDLENELFRQIELEAKEMERQQLKSEQIAKEHFRKQRDEGLLEQSKMYSGKDIINALHSVEVKYNRDFTKIYEGILEYLKEFKNK